MADCFYVCFDIQAEILKKLPVKSLIRFRSISKPWKSLIDSSKFIADHSVNRTRPNRLLVRYVDQIDSDFKYVSILDDDDDDSFPQKKVIHTIPMSDIFVDIPYTIIGISQGLFCFYNIFKSTTTVIWNPSIRKSVAIEMPNLLYRPFEPAIGFGVCPRTSDPKLIRITSFENWQVEVFTLSLGTWRSLSTNWPQRLIVLISDQVDLDGFIYWSAWEIVYVDAGKKLRNTIISFDMTTEEFTEVYLPPSLTNPTNPAIPVSISKLRDSLVVLENSLEVEEKVYGVWMMEHGVSRSFTKLFTIGPLDACIRSVLGFRKNGRPILEVKSMYGINLSDMVAYEPNSKHISHLGMYGIRFTLFASSYAETLLLLDQREIVSGVYFNTN